MKSALKDYPFIKIIFVRLFMVQFHISISVPYPYSGITGEVKEGILTLNIPKREKKNGGKKMVPIS